MDSSSLSCRFLVVTDPSADHRPLTEVSHVSLATIALCDRLSPMLCEHCYPWRQASLPSGLMQWILAQEVLRVHCAISREHPGRSCLICTSRETPERSKRRHFRVNGWLQLPRSLLSPWGRRLTCRRRCPRGLFVSQFPTEARSPECSAATEDGSAAPTEQGTEWHHQVVVRYSLHCESFPLSSMETDSNMV